MHSILGQPCDICGDIGIAEAIVTCSNCHKSREHIYCMHPNLCSVPKSWCCEPCQYNVNHHDNCYTASSNHRGQELEDLSVRENECVMANESSKVPDATKMGDIKTLKGSFSSDLLPTPNIISLGNDHVYQSSDHPECLTVGRVRASAPEKQNHEISQPLHDYESSLNFPGKSLSTGKFESVGVITTKGELHIGDETRRSPLNYTRPLVYGVKVKSQIEKLLLGVDKQAGKMGSLLSEDCICKEKPEDADLRCRENDTLNSKGSLKFVEEDLPNPPAVNSLWKGSFAVLDFYDELYEGVEAYPPRKLSRKAWLVSKEMPSMLQFKLKPRLCVWPKTFHRDSPSGFDISLYFRADDRCRENYNHLMQWMMEKDLSMVSRLKGTELLIFTSSQLPVESQIPGLNKQIFLWGVFIAVEGRHSYVDFSGKQEVNSPLLSSGIGEDSVTSNENDDQVVDMEIDMVETKEVGRANISSGSNSKIVCWENPDIHSQDAFTRVYSDRSRYLNQTIRDPYEDFDVPPGFQRQVALEGQNFSVDMKVKHHLSAAPVLDYNTHEDSVGVIDKIDHPDVVMDVDVAGGKDVWKADICFGRHSMAECLDNLDTPSQDILARVNLDQSTGAADKGFISISPLTVSTVHPKEDASPGISDSTKLVEGDSSAKRFNRHQQEVWTQQAPIQKQVMMQHAPLQQQQSMYQPSLLPSPKVKGTASEDLPPGFEHPGLLPSYKVEPITNGNLQPGFDQPCLLQSPKMKAIQSRNMSPGFFQIEPMRSGNVPPGFDQPSILPSLHRELSSRENLHPGFDTSPSHSVFVSNIPSQVKEPLLLEIFKVAGAVEGCKLIGEGESYGFVNYFDHQSAEHAILTLNGRPLFGQPIKVMWAHETLLRGPFTIFVGHLCPEITDANLFAFFSVFPSCLTARVARDHTHGISKLYGFVSFGDQQDAQNAIYNFTGKWLGNKQLICNWATKAAGSNDVPHR